MPVGLFITCVNDLMYPRTGRAVVSILERLGVEVDFPLAQTCCGQMHTNSGYAGHRLTAHFGDVFGSYEAVVAPSGSCVAHLRSHYAHVYELSEFLVDVLGVDDVGGVFPHRVTYHPTCHGLRMLGLGDKPLRLLRNVKGIELVPLRGATECCGFGGTFALKNSEVSTAMLADKCAAVLATEAEYVAAADNSCLTHIGGGLSRIGGPRAIHYAEILAGA
ncbi:(Fe-S)-binding protein [Allorhizocola rhizosphaerae]|uniref:(Fe-S)-binding protein n=1 Tax=Allorhizocola rhizosphaerae TaxID=1872709 RepID=UPI000E3D8A89|nr:(Fe-S)-binding protein [Allorhizocola rhizosphaerae]